MYMPIPYGTIVLKLGTGSRVCPCHDWSTLQAKHNAPYGSEFFEVYVLIFSCADATISPLALSHTLVRTLPSLPLNR